MASLMVSANPGWEKYAVRAELAFAAPRLSVPQGLMVL
jgi:hypothetical protein